MTPRRGSTSFMGHIPPSWQKRISELILKDDAEAVAECLSLSQRFGDSPDSRERLDVAEALYACARDLGVRRRGDAALEIAQEISSRFAEDPFYKVQALVAAALLLVAELQVAAGQLAVAIAAYDQALSAI